MKKIESVSSYIKRNRANSSYILTLDKYIEITDLDLEHFDTEMDYKIEVVAIFHDKDFEEVSNYQYSEINSEFDRILVLPQPSAKELVINGQVLTKIPFEKLTLGEWIDLEYWIAKPDTLLEMLSLLYRKTSQVDEMSPIQFEKYDNFISHRKPMFLEVDSNKVLSIRKEYIEYRNMVLDKYSGLFKTYNEEEEDLEELTRVEKEEYERAKALDERMQQFNWEYIIMNLVNNDITKFNQVLEMPLILVFNVLSSIKVKNSKV